MMDAGVLSVCELTNTAGPGEMPVEKLSVVATAFFEDRIVGYGRYFAARGVNEQIDITARTWRMPEVKVGMYAVLEQSEYDGQYRVIQVQHLLDDDGLKVTDISMSRLENYYELEEEAEDDQSAK